MNTPDSCARSLYASQLHGVLATLSLELPGYPFGSAVTYATDADGAPVLLLSDIAQHTHNIHADSRVSLTVLESAEDAQAAGRLTLVGDARKVEDALSSGLAERYFRRFPEARKYQEMHDFAFYRIELVKARYIGGFGRIHWVTPAALLQANPFAGTAEAGMAAHMNADHANALADYCRLYGMPPRAGETPRLSAIDTSGFDVMLGKRLLRIAFEQPVANATDVRKAMVALAHRARAPKPEEALA